MLRRGARRRLHAWCNHARAQPLAATLHSTRSLSCCAPRSAPHGALHVAHRALSTMQEVTQWVDSRRWACPSAASVYVSSQGGVPCQVRALDTPVARWSDLLRGMGGQRGDALVLLAWGAFHSAAGGVEQWASVCLKRKRGRGDVASHWSASDVQDCGGGQPPHFLRAHVLPVGTHPTVAIVQVCAGDAAVHGAGHAVSVLNFEDAPPVSTTGISLHLERSGTAAQCGAAGGAPAEALCPVVLDVCVAGPKSRRTGISRRRAAEASIARDAQHRAGAPQHAVGAHAGVGSGASDTEEEDDECVHEECAYAEGGSSDDEGVGGADDGDSEGHDGDFGDDVGGDGVYDSDGDEQGALDTGDALPSPSAGVTTRSSTVQAHCAVSAPKRPRRGTAVSSVASARSAPKRGARRSTKRQR